MRQVLLGMFLVPSDILSLTKSTSCGWCEDFRLVDGAIQHQNLFQNRLSQILRNSSRSSASPSWVGLSSSAACLPGAIDGLLMVS